jgi:hypothetical protein
MDFGRLEIRIDLLFDADELTRTFQIGDTGSKIAIPHASSGLVTSHPIRPSLSCKPNNSHRCNILAPAE